MIHNIPLERLQEIDQEREQTMSTASFQAWMKELGVSLAAEKPHDRARDMMSLWKDKNGNRTDFKQIVASLK